jgi:hypothetical protein
MKKLAVFAGVAAIVLGGLGSAEAQGRYRHGYYGGWGGNPYYYGGYRRGWGGGGALAAGLIGGALLGGVLAAGSRPAYAYPYPYPYPYPAYAYGEGDPYANGYGYAPRYYRGYPGYGYRARYVYPPRPYGGDAFAAPHEIRDGYRTVLIQRSPNVRVIVGPGY